MTRHRAVRDRGEAGFTLVELLVSCLIVGVLVGLALPAFAAQTSRADGASARTQARTAQTAMETHFTAAQSYDTGPAELVAIEPALASARALRASGDGATFRISVEDGSGRTFGVERTASGRTARFCAPAGGGACPLSGTW